LDPDHCDDGVFTGASQAAEDVSLLKDMTSVIALLGLPAVGRQCQTVGDNDHIASCQDGNRYRYI